MNVKFDVNPIVSAIWGIFQVILIILKAEDVITCSWLLVLIPIESTLIIFIILLIISWIIKKKYFN